MVRPLSREIHCPQQQNSRIHGSVTKVGNLWPLGNKDGRNHATLLKRVICRPATAQPSHRPVLNATFNALFKSILSLTRWIHRCIHHHTSLRAPLPHSLSSCQQHKNVRIIQQIANGSLYTSIQFFGQSTSRMFSV